MIGHPGRSRGVYFLIFTASGFAGLIYESIWTHYLKLFLGHAAYAQTLVLAIFMGGMAGGSWLCSRLSHRWPNLLRGYALVEGGIGIAALTFHPLYAQFLDLSYERLLPALGSPALVTAFKWTSSAILILPQSVLLGMTFPLMTAGVLRRFPSRSGAAIAMLYFTNSIGAAFGVLASGFFFIAWIGLPGTLALAGGINLVLALVVWTLAAEAERRPEGKAEVDRAGGRGYPFFLLVALVTGAASFIYEIGWIRMLNLVLGTSTHAFELMLSAFITGLALGGLWIRRRIDRLANPAVMLGGIQIVMGLMALATLPLYGNAFAVMQWLVENLEKTDAGYRLFNLGSHGIALAVMLPASFCAGMTLPLITHVLLRRGCGEKTIGAVYAWNTVGAILGVFIAVHVGLPQLGLKGLLCFGGALDVVLGLAILWWVGPGRRLPAAATAVSAALFLAVVLGPELQAHKLASGVYREGKLLDPAKTEILFQKHGKTASVSMTGEAGEILSLRTNGKTDACLAIAPGSEERQDEHTMIVAAVLGLAHHPEARVVANIGLGSGLTTHTLLGHPGLERVDTIEIERFMAEGARLFGPRVARAFEDPRSRIHIEDAKTFFSTHHERYDLIVSEPSNPWVSGVASLFSKEFYRRIRDHLESRGLLVQWLQYYEMDVPLVVSVLKALSSEFEHYEVYLINRGDLIIVARPDGPIPRPDSRVFEHPELVELLDRVAVEELSDLELRWLGDRRSLEPLVRSFTIAPNSDYDPVVDQRAARSRFMQRSAAELVTLHCARVPAMTMLAGRRPAVADSSRIPLERYLERSVMTRIAWMMREYHLGAPWAWPHPEVSLPANLEQYAELTRTALRGCEQPIPLGAWWDAMFNNLAKRVVPYLSAAELEPLWSGLRRRECWDRLDPWQQEFVELLESVGERDAAGMAGAAERLLEGIGQMDPAMLHYMLSAGMLGELAQGDPKAAHRLWTRYSPGLREEDRSSLLSRLLLAHALEG